MSLSVLSKYLEKRLQLPLPGNEAHLPLSSIRRIRALMQNKDLSNARKSAVLLLLYPDNQNDIYTVLIQRPVYDGVHGGQISLPGGKAEPSDPDLIYTALRESKEETGIVPEEVTILGTLTELYIPPSNMIVLPVIGYQPSHPDFNIDPTEVEDLIVLSLKELLNPDNFQQQAVSVGLWTDIVPCFNIRGNIVWGATAMILNELKMILPSIP
ncbi:MAG: CoA pyrophosphatase [Bacteroidales bacterium]